MCGLTACNRDFLKEMSIKSKFIFSDLSDNYIYRCRILKIEDLYSLEYTKLLQLLSAASKRYMHFRNTKSIQI